MTEHADRADGDVGEAEEGGEERGGVAVRLSLAEVLALDEERVRLSSGSPGIDFLLGGGYKQGAITEIYGASSTGKTQLGLQACAIAASRGWTSVYIDTESSFRPERLKEIAQARHIPPEAALDDVYCVEARSVSEEITAISRLGEGSRAGASRLVVVDTVTRNFSLEFPERQSLGKRQSLLSVYLNAIARDAYSHARVVLLLNRTTMTMVKHGAMARQVSVGGLTLRRFSTSTIRLERHGRDIVATLEALPEPMAHQSRSVTCSIGKRGVE